MNDFTALALAWIAGLILGTIFCGGLWWTVRKGMLSPRPALWFLGSLLLRMGLVMAGFFIVGQGDWRRLAACLVGFIMARILATRCFPSPIMLAKEPSHAP